MKNDRGLFLRNADGRSPVPGTPHLSPFGDARGNPLDAVLPTTKDVVDKVMNAYENPVPVLFPRTQAAPEGARTLDYVRYLTVASGATPVDLYQFTCKDGMTTVIFGYGLYTNAAIGADIEWYPTVDGKRVLQFHGVPNASGLGRLVYPVGNVEQLAHLVQCQIILEPKQVFKWQVRNTSGAPVIMAARTIGYVDASQRLTSTKFGD